MALLLAGCSSEDAGRLAAQVSDAGREDATPEDARREDADSGEVVQPCPAGSVLDGRICLPEGRVPDAPGLPDGCADRWPEPPADATTLVYVDASARNEPVEPDGSSDHPYSDLAVALAHASPRAVVLVAPGIYAGRHVLDGGLTVQGACAQAVAFEAAGVGPPTVTVEGAGAALRGLTVRGRTVAVHAFETRLRLEAVRLLGGVTGLQATASEVVAVAAEIEAPSQTQALCLTHDSTAVLAGVSVRGGPPHEAVRIEDSTLHLGPSSTVASIDSDGEEGRSGGIYLAGGVLHARQVHLTGLSVGVSATEGARVLVEDSTFDSNGAGLVVVSSTAQVRGGRFDGNTSMGIGCGRREGDGPCRLDVEGATITGSEVGVGAHRAVLRLVDVAIAEAEGPEPLSGDGLQAVETEFEEMRDLRVAGVGRTGLNLHSCTFGAPAVDVSIADAGAQAVALFGTSVDLIRLSALRVRGVAVLVSEGSDALLDEPVVEEVLPFGDLLPSHRIGVGIGQDGAAHLNGGRIAIGRQEDGDDVLAVGVHFDRPALGAGAVVRGWQVPGAISGTEVSDAAYAVAVEGDLAAVVVEQLRTTNVAHREVGDNLGILAPSIDVSDLVDPVGELGPGGGVPEG